MKVGPVVAVAGEAADVLTIPAHQEAVAVVLDLMEPVWPSRTLVGLNRQGEIECAHI